MKIVWEEKDTARAKRLPSKIIIWLVEVALMLVAGMFIAYFWGALELQRSNANRIIGFTVLYMYAKISQFLPKE